MKNKRLIPSAFGREIKVIPCNNPKSPWVARDYRTALLISGIVIGIITALFVCPHSAKGLQELIEAIAMSAH